MGVQGGELFTYKLLLKDSVRNILSGYAYTYLDPKNDVKAYVVAEVDKDNRTLMLREVNIMYNNYFKSNALICLIEAMLTFNKTEQVLSGPLITMTAGNGASCAKGSITFNVATELDHLFNNKPELPEKPVVAAPTPATPPKPARVIYDTVRSRPIRPAATAPPAEKKTEIITEGKDKTYNWTTDQIVLEIWDGNNEDNDRVTIMVNGEALLKNHVLTKQKKKLTIPVGGNELNIISIVADNEGGDPPNTANIMLSDGATQYEVIAHNTIGRKSLIKIVRKR